MRLGFGFLRRPASCIQSVVALQPRKRSLHPVQLLFLVEKVRAALLAMHQKDQAAIQAIDPKYEKWVSIRWEDYVPVKQTIDAVHGVAFYELKE